MRKFIFIIGLLVFFGSCKRVCFTSPQPAKGIVLKSFIKDIQGRYADSILDITIAKNEVLVNGSTFSLVSKNPESRGEALVKYFNNSYFINVKDSIYYSVYMARFIEGKLSVYMLNADERTLKSIGRLAKVGQAQGVGSYFIINATAKEFDQIVENEIFDVITVLPKKNSLHN